MFINQNRYIFKKISILIIFVWIFSIFISTSGIAERLYGNENKIVYKRLVPLKLSSKIFTLSTNLLKKIAGNISKKRDCKCNIYMSLMDNKNNIFWAFKGIQKVRIAIKTDKLNKYKVESNGDIALDLYIEKIGTKGKNSIFKYNGDVIISLDKLVLHMAKFVTKVGVAYGISYVSDNLITFLSKIDSKKVGTALYNGFSDFTSNTAGVATAQSIRHVVQYHSDNSIVKILIKNVKNGNILSFLALSLLDIAVRDGMKLVGISIGAMIGGALCTGAGEVIGALIAQAASLIIIHFVVKKVAIEFFFNSQLKKLLKIAKSVKNVHSTNFEKYKIYHNKIFMKLRDSIIRGNYEKFNQFMKFIKSKPKNDITYLKNIIKDVRKILQGLVLQNNDWNGSRRYYQLRELLKSKGLDARQFGY